MDIRNISVPECYLESDDFQFFLDWMALSLEPTRYKHERMFDLYDPIRIQYELLWVLADTMGYVQDDRLPIAFNRFVLLYFMSMIHLRGSKDGITLAAQANLKQFPLIEDAKAREDSTGDDILYNRLEDTSIPVNSVYVMPYPEYGYIDIVYFSTRKPIDACIEYVRPLGMFLFQHSGVRMDARTKVWIDGRLTDTREMRMSIGPTHVGHYTREDYARMQKMINEPEQENRTQHVRRKVWYRNSKFEDEYEGTGEYMSGTKEDIDPGYRSLYSLQLANNEHIVKSLLDPIFSLGYGPQDVGVEYPDDYLKPEYRDRPIGQDEHDDTYAWNLRYDRDLEEKMKSEEFGADLPPDVYTLDDDRTTSIVKPRPAVNPIMARMGDAMSLNEDDPDAPNTKYIHRKEDGTFEITDENMPD